MAVTSLLADLTTTRPLSGRVVVLTGATAGIGRAAALRLAARGATVVAVARHLDALEALAGEAHLARSPGRVLPQVADIADDSDRAGLVAAALAEHGRIDVLVSNVGVGWSGRVEDMELEQVRRLVETNVVAAIDLARLVLPGMLKRGDGDVLFTASGASWFAVPPLTVYSATKYAVEGFAEGLRREVWARGVRVHTVHPGLVSTEFAARSAGHDPGDVAGPPRPGPGIRPELVAAAIERALTRPGVHAVAVPRILGVTRLLKVPPLQQITDLLVALAADRLIATGRRVADRAAGPYRR